jgi:pimeloyl-ACP methyl ester carboxylesterase
MLVSDFLRRFEKDHDKEALMRLWSYWSFSPKAFERKNFISTFIRKASAYPYLQSAKGFGSQIGAMESFNASGRLKNIKAETLVITGSDDILIYPKESEKLVKGIARSVFEEMKDTGHCALIISPKPDLVISLCS